MAATIAQNEQSDHRPKTIGYNRRQPPRLAEDTMARIEPLGIDQVDQEIRHICEDAERQTGTSASPRTYARSPAAFNALTAFRAALGRDSTLDPVLRELVRLKVAGLNACRY
jgi:alkylhydroperoxidase family enzyme